MFDRIFAAICLIAFLAAIVAISIFSGKNCPGESRFRDYLPTIIALILAIAFSLIFYFIPPSNEREETDYEAGWNAGYEEGQYDAEVSMGDELNQYFCDGYEEGYSDALDGIEPQY